MLEFIRKAPFIRIAIPFIAGIIFRLYIPISYHILAPFICITFIFLIGSVILNKINKDIKNSYLFPLFIVLIVIFSGITLTSIRLNSLKAKIESGLNGYLICSIEELPEEKDKSIRCVVYVEKFFTAKESKIIKQKAFVYFQRNKNAENIQLGDVILIKAAINTIKGNGNPYEFDYGKYYEKQNIYYQLFADSSSWEKIRNESISAFNKFIITGRLKIINTFKQIGLKGNELSVALSLTIGYKTDLDSNIKQAFSSTGTMHILAVSGMHVGLIFLILSFALGFLDKFKYGKFVKALLIIIFIWTYAFLTGIPSSVFRAALMSSLFALGIIARRTLNPFNSIGISAFVILLIDPLQISDVGFQLSYMAVIGIITIYPIVYDWVKTGNRLLDPIIALLTVSFAAQIGTIPLTLLYFHQFPNYFLLTNLIIVPYSTLIIYFSLLIFAFSGWNSVLIFLGKVFYFLIKLLNNVVLWFDQFPFITTNNIFIRPIQVILLYIGISAVYFFIKYRKKYLITALLITINLFILSGLIQYLKQKNTNAITFYNVPKHALIQFRWGLKNVWIIDEYNEPNKRTIKNTLQNTIWKESKVLILDSILNNSSYLNKQCINFPLVSNKNTIKFLDKTLQIGITNNFDNLKTPDFCIIRQNDFVALKKNPPLGFKKIIFLDRNPQKIPENITNKMNKISENAQNFVYCLRKQGALQIQVGQNKN